MRSPWLTTTTIRSCSPSFRRHEPCCSAWQRAPSLRTSTRVPRAPTHCEVEMLYRIALVVFLVAGCEAPRTHSSDDGTHAPDAGPLADATTGTDAGPGSNCG